MSKKEDEMNSPTSEIQEDFVRRLAEILDQTNLSEIEYDTGSLRIRVSRQVAAASVTLPSPSPAPPPPTPEPQSAPTTANPATHPGAVKAPMVGVAYLAAEPDTPPYVKVGDTVSEGQTLMLIEAMKTFNPVRAPRAGTISDILVTDGQPIEFDQPLVVIE